MFEGRAERPANTIPVCWTVWGSRRASWIWIDEDEEIGLRAEIVRDIFGYQITDGTKVITNVWNEGDEYYEQRSVQEVDYPHRLDLQHRASLAMDSEIYGCALQEVISLRAGLHFVHLWKRNARMKVLRRQTVWPLFLLCWKWKRRMPPAVIQNTYTFLRPRHPEYVFASCSEHCCNTCMLYGNAAPPAAPSR